MLSLSLSAAVHAKHEKAEKHSDPHKGDGRGRREKLLVVDAQVPHHSQDPHKHGHHQTARTDDGPEASRDPRPDARPGLRPFLCSRLVQGLGDVAVDHTIVCDVE